jgi:hypothetical protein
MSGPTPGADLLTKGIGRNRREDVVLCAIQALKKVHGKTPAAVRTGQLVNRVFFQHLERVCGRQGAVRALDDEAHDNRPYVLKPVANPRKRDDGIRVDVESVGQGRFAICRDRRNGRIRLEREIDNGRIEVHVLGKSVGKASRAHRIPRRAQRRMDRPAGARELLGRAAEFRIQLDVRVPGVVCTDTKKRAEFRCAAEKAVLHQHGSRPRPGAEQRPHATNRQLRTTLAEWRSRSLRETIERRRIRYQTFDGNMVSKEMLEDKTGCRGVVELRTR